MPACRPVFAVYPLNGVTKHNGICDAALACFVCHYREGATTECPTMRPLTVERAPSDPR